MNRLTSRIWLCLLFSATACGCGWWGADEEPDYEQDLPTLDAAAQTEAPPSSAPSAKAGEKERSQAPSLTPGMRVPLRKRVVQTLNQGDRQSRTTLQLDLTVSIDEILDDGRRRFGAHYDRVRYTGEIAGDAFDYDSDNPTPSLPVQVLPFHGLAGNDFYFWIDAGGRIELIGFDRFLRRCVARLPASERRAVLAHFAVVSDEEGVALFVDETVGLLFSRPAQSAAEEALKPGETWTTRRTLRGKVPMQILTEYVVKTISPGSVEIEIRGVVRPSNQPILSARGTTDPVVTITGGKTLGRCTLDRSTGLPASSRFEQFIDMQVELADGTRFDQHKHVLTTIEPADAPRSEEPAEASPLKRLGGAPSNEEHRH